MHIDSRGRQLSVTHRATLFEDRNSDSRYHNAAFPSLVRCPDGSILLAHRVGSKKNSADGKQLLWRFDGREWQRQSLQLSCALPPLRELRTAALSNLGDEKLSMLVTWIDHPDPSCPIANPETEGLLPVHIGFTVSADSGVTWSPVSEIPVHPLEQPCGNGPVRRGQDGRWVAAFEVYKHYADASPWSARAAAVCSLDNGCTWLSPQIIAQDPALQICYWDLHLVTLKEGRWLGLGWLDDRQHPGQSATYWVQSTDGENWSPPRKTGIEGQFIDLLELPDGRLILCYVTRAEHPAIRIRVVDADPLSWPEAVDHFVYEQDRNDLADADRGSFGDYLRGMSQWSFGWPSLLLLDEDRLLVAFYSGGDDFSGIRLAEVRLSH
jgi:sialidase-1